MKTSILVPLRPEKGPIGKARLRNWAWIRARWEAHFPEAELVVARDDGEQPFSKSIAVNNAYAQASGDMLVIADADSWVDMPQIVAGISYAAQLGILVVPWIRAHRLSASDTDQLLSSDPTSPRPVSVAMIKAADDYRPSPSTAAMVVILSRSDFERVGGFDPLFRGWGAEDVSFGLACGTLLGRSHIMPGEAYALHHERPRKDGLRVWQNDPAHHNRARADLYWAAKGNAAAMLRLCREHPLSGASTPVEVGPSQSRRPVDQFVHVFEQEKGPDVLVREFQGTSLRDGDRFVL